MNYKAHIGPSYNDRISEGKSLYTTSVTKIFLMLCEGLEAGVVLAVYFLSCKF